MRQSVQIATSQQIFGEEAIKNFLTACIKEIGLWESFHPDTDFRDYVNEKSEDFFTEEEVIALEKSMLECFEQCDLLDLDISDITLEIFANWIDTQSIDVKYHPDNH